MDSIIQPVAKIIGPNGERGVGFLIDACHLVTTQLLIPDETTALNSDIHFYPNADGQESFTTKWQVKPGSFKYDIDRDVVLLELEPDHNDTYAGDQWGYFSMATMDEPVSAFDELIYMHYPEGDDAVESGQVLVTETDDHGWLYYYGSWLLEGSCGAPLLNKHMQVVGVHSRKFGPADDNKKKGGRLPEQWRTMACSRKMAFVA